MKKKKATKTNAMRMLDQAGVDYKVNTYEIGEEHVDGVHIAQLVHAPVEQVYKTRITIILYLSYRLILHWT